MEVVQRECLHKIESVAKKCQTGLLVFYDVKVEVTQSCFFFFLCREVNRSWLSLVDIGIHQVKLVDDTCPKDSKRCSKLFPIFLRRSFLRYMPRYALQHRADSFSSAPYLFHDCWCWLCSPLVELQKKNISILEGQNGICTLNSENNGGVLTGGQNWKPTRHKAAGHPRTHRTPSGWDP